MSARRYAIRGGTVVLADRTVHADVLVEDGCVVAVGADLDTTGAEVLDAAGCAVGPGLVDLHAHLREPGDEESETIETAARAAALGGYTAVVAMPNTQPCADGAAVVADVLQRARGAACEVLPAGAITMGRRGESLAPMAEMAALGVTIFTDDGSCVADGDLMRRALEYAAGLGAACAQHCEDPVLAAGGVAHEGARSSRLGLRGQPALAETAVVYRDLGLAELTGARLHLLHLSVPESVELVAGARARGLDVTCEVAPHHLTLTDECLEGYDPRFKVSPPLRPAAARDALRELLREGRIDAVATDHAPHPEERKEVPFDDASPGMLGLQHACGLVVDALGGTEGLDLRALFALLSRTPARIARLRATDARPGGHSPQGELAEGSVANLCVVDLQTPLVVEARGLASRSANSPYLGRKLPVSVRHTLLRGEPVVQDGAALR